MLAGSADPDYLKPPDDLLLLNIRSLSAIKEKCYCDLRGQVLAISLRGSTTALLRIWDGTTPPGSASSWPLDPSDPNPCTRLKKLDDLVRRDGLGVDILAYDQHRETAAQLKPGQFVILINVHFYRDSPSNRCVLMLHGKNSLKFNRGIYAVPSTHRRIRTMVESTLFRQRLGNWKYDPEADGVEEINSGHPQLSGLAASTATLRSPSRNNCGIMSSSGAEESRQSQSVPNSVRRLKWTNRSASESRHPQTSMHNAGFANQNGPSRMATLTPERNCRPSTSNHCSVSETSVVSDSLLMDCLTATRPGDEPRTMGIREINGVACCGENQLSASSNGFVEGGATETASDVNNPGSNQRLPRLKRRLLHGISDDPTPNQIIRNTTDALSNGPIENTTFIIPASRANSSGGRFLKVLDSIPPGSSTKMKCRISTVPTLEFDNLWQDPLQLLALNCQKCGRSQQFCKKDIVGDCYLRWSDIGNKYFCPICPKISICPPETANNKQRRVTTDPFSVEHDVSGNCQISTKLRPLFCYPVPLVEISTNQINSSEPVLVNMIGQVANRCLSLRPSTLISLLADDWETGKSILKMKFANLRGKLLEVDILHNVNHFHSFAAFRGDFVDETAVD